MADASPRAPAPLPAGHARRDRRGEPFGIRLFAWAGFPAAVAATTLGCLALMDAGLAPELAIGPPLFAFYAALALAERRVPWHASWLSSKGDLGTDLGLFLVNSIATPLLGPLVLVAAAAAGAWASQLLGSGLWPTAWPILGQLALGLGVAELVEYSVHRAMHEVPWLWRFHATHHSAPRLYWLNAVRFHPIDLFVVGTGKLVPLALLGAGPEVFALVSLFSGVHGAYQHANVPVRLGPLNWVFSMSELHRWHHAPATADANHNYGGNLILWDVVFGTRYLPADREPPEAIGMEEMPDFPMGLWENLLAPFRWSRVVARSRGGSA